MKNWIKEHIDTVAVIAAIVGATWAIHTGLMGIKTDMHAMDVRLINQMNDLDKRLTAQIVDIDKRLNTIEVIMLMQGYPIKHASLENEELKNPT